MTGRKCLTCKHYEASPIWRKGWCRNPLLYAPQQSHLVQQDDLDCSRGVGSYWEAADPATQSEPLVPERPVPIANDSPKPGRTWRLFPAPPLLAPVGAAVAMSTTGGGTGGGGGGRSGGGFSGGTPPSSGPPRPDRTGGLPGQERIVSYQPEERYWTDYLRIALPVVGLLLMLGLFWFWANSLIGDDSDNEPAATATVATTISTVAASTVTPSAVTTQPAIAPTTETVSTETLPTTTGGAEPTTTTDEATEPPGGFADGTIVYTTDSLNFRSEPSTANTVILRLLEIGTELTVIGASVPGTDNDITWYPVSDAEGTTGFVAEEYLTTTAPE